MTTAKLGRCPRCKAYTLVAERQGLRVAVDIAPADAIAFGHAVANGVELYWAQNEPGRPASVLGRRSAGQNPSWGAGGVQTGAQRLHREHSCGAHPKDIVIINPASSGKGSAPATPGAAGAGNLLPAAPGSSAPGPWPPSRASTATPHRSERAIRCDVCNKLIDRKQPHFAIDHESYAWGVHEECP